MPQLDKVTFFSQFFWLCFFFLGFYFVLLKYFLPKMSRILKFRNKKMSTSQEGVTSMQKENDKVRDSYQSLVSSGLNLSENMLKKNLQHTEKWLESKTENANKTKLEPANKAYIYSLGETVFSQNLALSQPFAQPSKVPLPLFLETLFTKLYRNQKKPDFLGIHFNRNKTIENEKKTSSKKEQKIVSNTGKNKKK